ncbi:MAG: bifunctional homocysteine S-methyltransferase/methylenetetrahydrofolate reductase [Candidatus Lernaella stagnicola]|nr:bifunctional homocysteine S-methyltransferase/methylenetetrahydrofolate reductase [Candidatus Lernaella stagnicola]
MAEKTLRELLAERVVVFDGAMGTELYKRHQFVNVCYDQLNLTKPEMIREVHEANKRAGADVLTTNSFGANRRKLTPFLLADQTFAINKAAAEIAREVAGDDCLVAGSVGPLGVAVGLGGLEPEKAIEMFAESIGGLKAGGVDFLIIETFSRRETLLAAIRAAAQHDMPYIPSITVGEQGITRYGETIDMIYAPFPEDLPEPIMLGFNCGVGPAEWLEFLEQFIPRSPYPVLVQPNAGFPKTVDDRLIYMTSPEYFMTYALHFVQVGARAVGGCCGTAPEHIRELASSVKTMHKKHVEIVEKPEADVELVDACATEEKSRFAWKIAHGQWVTTVEIVPPLGYDLTRTIERARTCHIQGVDAINIPDGPRASSRVSPLIAAMQIQQNVGIEVILHLTCRDRNVIGMQSDLLGCAAAGINNILIITGDPPKLGDYPFATAVFDLDSIGYTKIAARLNRGVDIGGHPVRPPTCFIIGVGTDPTHLDQEREVDRFHQKIEAGAEYCITQPVFDPEVLLRFVERVGDSRIPILAGIWPLASLRNAEFMNNEVPGVHVPEAVMKRMAGAATKEEARAVGITIARELRDAMRDHVAGIQVSAPFGNVNTALAVIQD